MMRIYYCDHMYTKNPHLHMILLLLEEEGIGFTTQYNPEMVMKLTNGNSHPKKGFVCVTIDETIIKSIYDLCDWINAKGLRRC